MPARRKLKVESAPLPPAHHPWAVRITHWTSAVTVTVLALSGLQIFSAFPSFGPKVPQEDLISSAVVSKIALGGWLGGALRWHFTFMWIFMAAAALYVVYEIVSGHYKTVLFVPKDIPGVWPMARHYFFFGPKPKQTEQYNALQKLAYTSTLGFGLLSLLTGLAIFKPAQFSPLVALFGGYHYARGFHFLAMCGFLAFIPGHLVMVAIHGWKNFYGMLDGGEKIQTEKR
jgi:thiosulfate reductase cytochrome b subunit